MDDHEKIGPNPQREHEQIAEMAKKHDEAEEIRDKCAQPFMDAGIELEPAHNKYAPAVVKLAGSLYLGNPVPLSEYLAKGVNPENSVRTQVAEILASSGIKHPTEHLHINGDTDAERRADDVIALSAKLGHDPTAFAEFIKHKRLKEHSYPSGSKSTSDCSYGCGCSRGPFKAKGPEGIDPNGECPNNV